MAYTRNDFLQALSDETMNYPAIAQAYQAGDPRLLANLGAAATMLAMLSAQLDEVSMEPFSPARDTTVLADASMKGLLPFARPPHVVLSVENGSAVPLRVVVGRRLLDQKGRVYIAESEATIEPGASADVNARQLTRRIVQHTVVNSTPFYEVQVPASDDDDVSISGLVVNVAGTVFPFRPEFSNVGRNEPAYALEVDEYRRLYVKFGWADVFGVQPANGTVVQLTIEETFGPTDLSVSAPFTFEALSVPAEQFATVTLSRVTFPGAAPIDIDTMREYARYPSTYNRSAVYLGNFDFLIRENLPGVRFLSVWNEQIEESVRGASFRNINTLFISVLMDGVEREWLEAEISRIVTRADNSYRLRFIPAVHTPLPLEIDAAVSVVHDPGDVEAKIRNSAYSLYGRDAQAARFGMMQINSKRLGDALQRSVLALQDDLSDCQIRIPVSIGNTLPEQYRYITAESLTVKVTQSTYNDGMWSH
ncbi:hypothetical protein [Burkholderia ambifaria]|uniref:hypothetical protein n=1 Tax=Burkholderia ambifaria TaxID=152480 RepID=UPI00158EF500|nr:hypothetical protein [Burkholderia ambifaria]